MKEISEKADTRVLNKEEDVLISIDSQCIVHLSEKKMKTEINQHSIAM